MGGVYFGGRLAEAHTRLVPDLSAASLEGWVVCGQAEQVEEWFGSSGYALVDSETPRHFLQGPVFKPGPRDPASSPELHALEESCSQSGSYPEGLDVELTLSSGHRYSTLHGLEAAASPAPQVTSAELKSLGWSVEDSLWAFCRPESLAASLPQGVSWSEDLAGLELRLLPQQQSGQVVLHFASQAPLSASQDLDLEKVWRELPAGATQFCIRKDVLQRVWQLAPEVAASHKGVRILRTAEDWLGMSSQQEWSASQLTGLWNQFGQGWLPVSLWSDFRPKSVGGGQYLALKEGEQGTLFGLGQVAEAGPSVGPWEGRELEKGQLWLGGGHFVWNSGTESRRVNWLLRQNSGAGRWVIDFHWEGSVGQKADSELATMGPDLESIYSPRPNVIAGR